MSAPQTRWRPGPQRPSLSANAVHVWRFSLVPPPGRLEEFASYLRDEEAERMSRFKFDHLQRKYAAAHGVMRVILGRYLGAAPRDLRFAYTEYKKPYLATPFAEGNLAFNLSHSHELGALAVTRLPCVGVDIEHARPGFAGEKIARRYFAPGEVDALLALPEAEREQAFLNCWTRKEAFIKAIGEGLSHPLANFTVTLAPGEPARLSHIEGDASETAAWSMSAFDPGDGYAGAWAVRGPGAEAEYWDWI